MPTKYSEDFIKKAVKRYEKGESIPVICQDINVALSTFYRWIKVYCSIHTPKRTYTPFEFDAITRRLVKAEHELEVIRLSKCITDVPLRERLEILASLHEQYEHYSIHELCEALDVSRGTFYNHIFRKADRSKYQEEKIQLMAQVQQIFDDSSQRFGAKKICAVLADTGVRVSSKRISAIMQELDLQSIRTDAKSAYKKRQKYLKQNLLKRNFKAEHVNQTWVSDITYFKINNYGIYLCVVIDLFSRKVISYKVSRNSSTHLVTSTFKAAFQERGRPEGLTFHNDRGGQYISSAFAELLHKCNVTQSFSVSGRPCDNAVAETFFATFKREEVYRRDYSSEQDFRKSVEQYITFYNEARPHQTLAYKTPTRFEKLYGKCEELAL